MSDNQSLVWIVLGIVIIAGILFAINDSLDETDNTTALVSESE